MLYISFLYYLFYAYFKILLFVLLPKVSIFVNTRASTVKHHTINLENPDFSRDVILQRQNRDQQCPMCRTVFCQGKHEC